MRTPTRLAASILLILALLWALPVEARVPEPDHIFFGLARRSGVPLTSGVVTVVSGAGLTPLATFNLDGVTANFVLRVPIDSLAPQDPGTARPGDTARIYVNGQLAATTTVGERGTATQINVDESGATTTALASSANPAPLGIGIKLTATVAPASGGAGQPTGSVTFKDGTTVLAANVPLDASSRATYTLGSLTLGSHELIAEYGGGGIFGASRSDGLQQGILSQTATLITGSASTLRTGQPLTLTADVRTLSAGGGTPAGTVVFRDGATSLGAVPLSGAAQAILNLPSLDKGTHHLTAEYSGAPTFFPSRGGPIDQGVAEVQTCSAASYSASPAVAAGTDPRSLVAGDWNRDGRVDLAVANSASNDLTLLLGDSLGGFVAAAGPTPVGISPQAVVEGDFNGDGNPDLAVAARNSNEVRVLLGDGAGHFTAGGIVTVPLPRALVAADFNLDGRLDLATANQTANTVTLLLGDGVGGLVAQAPVPVGTLPVAVASADLNGDGRPDLVVANASSSNVSILLGDGLGGMSSAASVAVPANPQALAIADFNGDGKPDLVTVQSISWDVRVLLGDGAGGFAEAAGSPFAAGSQPRAVAVGDVDLDGKLDIAVINGASGDVTVLAGNGAGGFAPAVTRGLGTTPYAVTMADFNGDGRLDLAAANSGSNDVSVLLSNCTAITQTVIVSSWTPSTFGETVVFTATVTVVPPGSGLPGGKVAFTDAGATLGSGYLNDSGQAVLVTDSLLSGTHSIAAAYAGDANFAGSSSPAITQVVEKVGTSTGLVVSPLSTVFGQIVTFTATVLPLAPGRPAPSGSVVFRDGGGALSTAPLVGGVATFVTRSLGAAVHTLQADYTGDVNYNPSSSGPTARTIAPAPVLSVNDVSIPEGNSGTSSLAFTVSLSPASLNPVTVFYATQNQSATAGTDYTTTSGTLTFNPGETTQTVSVTVQGDTSAESDEALTLSLSAPVNATIVKATGFGIIRNDDGGTSLPGLFIEDGAADEGNDGSSLLSFNITLDAPSPVAISVDYATSDGTAVAGSDYLSATGTFTIPAGVTSKKVVVTLKSDLTVELEETLLLTLSHPVNATLLKTVATGTIVDDDPPPTASSIFQYRLYHDGTKEHLYTTDLNEYNVLGSLGWAQEGVAYQILNKGYFGGVLTVPLFRMYNPGILQHHLTTDVNEVSVLSGSPSWYYEGVVGYVLPTQVPGSVPLYRLSLAAPPLHLWTSDKNEYDSLPAFGWIKEGVIGYVIP